MLRSRARVAPSVGARTRKGGSDRVRGEEVVLGWTGLSHMGSEPEELVVQS